VIIILILMAVTRSKVLSGAGLLVQTHEAMPALPPTTATAIAASAATARIVASRSSKRRLSRTITIFAALATEKKRPAGETASPTTAAVAAVAAVAAGAAIAAVAAYTCRAAAVSASPAVVHQVIVVKFTPDVVAPTR